MENLNEITLLKNAIKQNIKDKKPYSQRMVTSLSVEAFKVAYNNEKTDESLAYQRGLLNGMGLILGMIDEINENDL